MLNRHHAAVVFLSLGLALPLTAVAQDQPTAGALYQQGMTQFHEGHTARARALLRRVDPMQLSKNQRVNYYKALQALDRRSRGGGTKPLPAGADAIAGQRADGAPSSPAPAGPRTPTTPAANPNANPHAGNPANPTGSAGASAGTPSSAGSSGNSSGSAGPAPSESIANTAAAPSGDMLASARKLRAQQRAAQARRAMTQGQANLAVKRYKQAVSLDPDNAQYRDQLQAAIAAQNQQESPQTPITSTVQSQRVQQQAVIAKYEQEMNAAQGQLAKGDYSQALDETELAKSTLDQNRQLLPTARYTDLRQKAESLSATITEEQNKANANKLAQAEQKGKRTTATTRARAQLQKIHQVQDLLQEAYKFRNEMKYKKALQQINQALFIDPTNPAAQIMKQMTQDAWLAVKSRQQERKKSVLMAKQTIINNEASMPYTDLIKYPSDWPELTKTRLADLQNNAKGSDANRHTASLLQQPVPVSFDGTSLSNAISYFRQVTGANFFVNWPALENVGIDRDTPVSLQLNNVPAEQALNLVLQQVGANSQLNPIGYSIIHGVVTISTQQDLKSTTQTRVYSIRDLLVDVPSFSNAPNFDLANALSNTNSGGGGNGGGGGGGGNDEGIFGDQGNDNNQEENKKTREEKVTQLTSLITDTIGTPSQWTDQQSSLRELNGNLIIKTTPSNHRDIRKLLDQLRETRAVQISVESRFLVVNQNFLEQFGIDLDVGYHFDYNINPLTGQYSDYYGGPGVIGVTSTDSNGNPVGIVGTDPNIPAVPGYPPSNGYAYAAPGTPVSIFQPIATNGGKGNNFGPVTAQQNSIDMAGPRGTGLTPTQFLDTSALSVGASFLNDLQVNLLVKATQADSRSLTLTAPRVTFFDGQEAYVVVATQIAFVSDLTPIPDAAGFDPTISVISSGAVLDVQGTVSADRRYVTLTLRPSLADVQQPIRTISITGTTINNNNGTTNGNNAPGVVVSGKIELPQLQITEVRATVSVPDRGTLLIGGQRLVGQNEVEAGVPVLSKIPILNRLFTNRSTVKDERTLLILVKPTVIIQSEQEDKFFPGLSDNPQKYNVGNTSGQTNTGMGLGPLQ